MIRKQPPGDVDLMLPNNFEEVDADSISTLQSLHSILPQCWNFEPERRPRMRVLSQICKLSTGAESVSIGNEGAGLSGLRRGTTLQKALQGSSAACADNNEGAQAADMVDVQAGPTPENLLKRRWGGPYSPENADSGDGDGRRVQARVSASRDGSTGAEVDEEREGNTLKTQLLALVAAIDRGSQMAKGQVPHDTRSQIGRIREALGHKWESQLATVLKSVHQQEENGRMITRPIDAKKGQPSDPLGFQLQGIRGTSPALGKDPDSRMENF
ncbi:hypothetical protein FRC00_004814 [Tulasnella sp. 408]|nr:hypothetical protein FRC00_004814 [Tulasnella sp. 408]